MAAPLDMHRALLSRVPPPERPLQAGSDSWQNRAPFVGEAGMASILPFLRKTGVAFDDHATKDIGDAFDAACIALHDTWSAEDRP
jgi:hypothetical protein